MRYRCRVFAVLVVLLVGASFAARAADDAYKRVSKKIVCQCSCNYPLDSCPHTECGWAPQVRAAISKQVAAGKGEEEILAGLVGQYGEVVLAAPPPEGFNLVGWVMPFAALILGLWLVRRVLLTWRRRTPAPGATPALVARYRKAIEKELKSLEET
ncbi:MAG: cytochrome c-type biogenesis protein CcmH [Terriglobia bacterium]